MFARRHGRWIVIILALCLLAVPLRGASADEERFSFSGAEAPSSLGGNPRLLANGLYKVTIGDGYSVTTHGPDPDIGHNRELGPGDPERHPVCGTGYVQHVLYGRPALISTSRVDEVKEEIRGAIRRMNALLNESSLASGGPTADFNVLCDDAGEIRIDEFVNPTIVPYFTNIVDGARRAGFNDPDVDYTIFYDDDFPAICGVGSLAYDDSPTASNANNRGGYGVTYRSCWMGRTPMHENGHNQGAVQKGAPNEDGTNHCTEHADIMCYPGTYRPCPEVMYYDCGFDTYFDSAPESGEWLEDHWNIGSDVNRYITFGAPEIQSPSPLEDPDVGLRFSTTTPRRNAELKAVVRLGQCPGHENTVVELQRRSEGRFHTVARKKLDGECTSIFSVRARFSSATFRGLWTTQDDDHFTDTSPSQTIRTRP